MQWLGEFAATPLGFAVMIAPGQLVFAAAATVPAILSPRPAYQGRRLAGWQQSLARLPLRWAGYGTKEGRPLEAARGSPRAKIVLLLSIATSILIIVLLTWLLILR
ncbi:MAG: hypothetical protein IH983_06485 [Planctomycetes bacterium]|nr:hypothetical protein [Planctomycetota bacterium]